MTTLAHRVIVIHWAYCVGWPQAPSCPRLPQHHLAKWLVWNNPPCHTRPRVCRVPTSLCSDNPVALRHLQHNFAQISWPTRIESRPTAMPQHFHRTHPAALQHSGPPPASQVLFECTEWRQRAFRIKALTSPHTISANGAKISFHQPSLPASYVREIASNAAWDNAPQISPTKCCKLQVAIWSTRYGRILQWALVHHHVISCRVTEANCTKRYKTAPRGSLPSNGNRRAPLSTRSRTRQPIVSLSSTEHIVCTRPMVCRVPTSLRWDNPVGKAGATLSTEHRESNHGQPTAVPQHFHRDKAATNP